MCEPDVTPRPQFGGRFLNAGEDVFQHNAWDNVEWGEEQERDAQAAVDKATSTLVEEERALEYEKNADQFWDKFYSIHQNRFFKERNWLFTEFPDLAPGIRAGRQRVFGPGTVEDVQSSQDENEEVHPKGDGNDEVNCVEDTNSLDGEVAKLRENEEYFGSNSGFRILEIGCGTGSSVFPILEVNTRPDLMVYCCDLSSQAVQLVKEHKEYKEEAGRCFAWVTDVTLEDWKAPFPPNSLDAVTLIFVLSAISPSQMGRVVSQIFKYLKPGGLVMFRDYGRYDLAQLRFKPGRCISENFYARADGTRVFFFSQEELKNLFEGAGFVEKQNLADRRLQVNRGKKLKMYRVWIQAKYQKPLEDTL